MSGIDEDVPISERPKCAQHGLVVGPDGRCVLCRRDSVSPSPSVRSQMSIPPHARMPGQSSFPPPADPSAPPKPAFYSNPPPPIAKAGFPWFGLLAVLVVCGGGYYGYVRMTGDATTQARPEVSETVADPHAASGESEPGDSSDARIALPRNNDGVERSLVELPADGKIGDPTATTAQRTLSPGEVAAYVAALDVELYATATCGFCEKTRKFFAANGVRYREHDVEADPYAKAKKNELSPGTGVPVVRIEDQVITGYQPQAYATAISRAVEARSGVRVIVGVSEE